MTMEDELTISLDGKTIGNLRVVDLKQELEKRGLSKSGSKKDLVKRLKQQLQFEKLCEESKSTGDCELKKELDAATEQNEFVQRYLAQQQKIFAEQKEMKRLVELEEIQKKTELKEDLSSHGTSSDSSSDESEIEHDVGAKRNESDSVESAIKTKTDNSKSSDKKDKENETFKDDRAKAKKIQKSELKEDLASHGTSSDSSSDENEIEHDVEAKRNESDSAESAIKTKTDNSKSSDKKDKENGNFKDDRTKEIQMKIELKEDLASHGTSLHNSSDESETEHDTEEKENKSVSVESAIKTETDDSKISDKKDKGNETLEEDKVKSTISFDITEESYTVRVENQKDIILNKDDALYINKKEFKQLPESETDLSTNVNKDAVVLSNEADQKEQVSRSDTQLTVIAEHSLKSIASNESDQVKTRCESDTADIDVEYKSSVSATVSVCPSVKDNIEHNMTKNAVTDLITRNETPEVDTENQTSENNETGKVESYQEYKKETITELMDDTNESKSSITEISVTKDNEEKISDTILMTETTSNMSENLLISPSSSLRQNNKAFVISSLDQVQRSDAICHIQHTFEFSSSKKSSSVSSEDKVVVMESTVPYSLSDIKLPDSPSNVMQPSEKISFTKEASSPLKLKELTDKEECHSDKELQANGVGNVSKSSDKLSKDEVENISSDKDKSELEKSVSKEEKKDSKTDNLNDLKTDKENKSKLNHKKSSNIRNSTDSENKLCSKVGNEQDPDSQSSDKESNSEESGSGESSSSEKNKKRKSKITSPKQSHRKKARTPSSSSSNHSSKSRESSPENESIKGRSTIKNKYCVSNYAKIVPQENTSSKDESSCKNSTVAEDLESFTKEAPRKKLKINRNNVVILPAKKMESLSPEKRGKSSRSSTSKADHGTSEKDIKYGEISNPTSKKISEENVFDEKSKKPSSPVQSSSEANEPEMGEIIENSPEMKYETRKLNFPGRKLSRKLSDEQPSAEPKAKKSKWGKFASAHKTSQTINISTDSLKNWFPEFKLVSEPATMSESVTEDSPPRNDNKKLSFTINTEIVNDKKTTLSNSELENNIEQVMDTTESSGPVSKIVFIQNLVRPFTLLQLKELLKQTGHLIEEEFWIDKIKSKCFATYETEEDAIKTRNALNGMRWPSSNPKILSAEFSTIEELELHRTGADVPKAVPESLSEVQETLEQKVSQPSSDHRKRERDSDKRKDRERYRQQLPVREWDKDKISQESPDRENGKDLEGLRVTDKKEKKDSKKRVNEDTPAKLLDDLFQKTKSAPCIYWLPLTELQVVEREEARKLRRLEREKRIQQREQEEADLRNKRPRSDHKLREIESRRSSSRSRSPATRRR